MRGPWRTIGAAGIVAAVLVMSALPASACSCMGSGPPCQAYFETDAVFVGTVQSIDVRQVRLEYVNVPVNRRLVHLSIERAVRGVQGREVAVDTGSGGGDCGYDFTIGQRYVVYAHRGTDGSLGTGICSRTRPIADASEDLAFFSAIPATAAGARVFGTIKHAEQDAAAGRMVVHPIANVQVIVRGQAGVFTGTTDADGQYAIAAVPPGKYETDVLPPSEFSGRSSWGFEITDARACRALDFWLPYAGRIAGGVLDAAGHPASGVRVEIASASTPDRPMFVESARSITDANGLFELSEIQPGSYVVGVGVTLKIDQSVLYPRSMFPRTIDVGKGNRVDIGTLRLPEPSRRYELKGTTVGAEGSPIAGADVVLFASGNRQATMPVKTAADGTFTVSVFDGQAYTVRARIAVSDGPIRQAQAAQSITIHGDPPPIRLVLVVR